VTLHGKLSLESFIVFTEVYLVPLQFTSSHLNVFLQDSADYYPSLLSYISRVVHKVFYYKIPRLLKTSQ